MTTLTLNTTTKHTDTAATKEVAGVQVGAGLHGNHSLTPRQIDVNQAINPATGHPYVQVGPRPQGGMISPPPSRNFKGS